MATDRDPSSDNFNTMIVSLMRDQMSVQNAQNNSFREAQSEQNAQNNSFREAHSEQNAQNSQQMELVRQQQNQITNVSNRVSDVESRIGEYRKEFNSVHDQIADLRGQFTRMNEKNEQEGANINEAEAEPPEANARHPDNFDSETRFPSLNMMFPKPGEGGYVNQEDSFISGKEVVVGKAFSCHSRSDIVKCVNCFGGKVKRIFCRDDIGEYRL